MIFNWYQLLPQIDKEFRVSLAYLYATRDKESSRAGADFFSDSVDLPRSPARSPLVHPAFPEEGEGRYAPRSLSPRLRITA
jgi:hypothetical protein